MAVAESILIALKEPSDITHTEFAVTGHFAKDVAPGEHIWDEIKLNISA